MVMDLFVGFFTNPLNLVMMGIFIGVGLLIGLFLRPWMGNQVVKIIPADHRFIDLGIEEETSISIECQKVKGMPPQRFFKLHPGFTGIVGKFLKKPITRYFGMEGTAYTWEIENGYWRNLGSLGDAVRTLWGEKFWGTVPETMRDKLTESTIQVTVGLEKAPLTPAGMRSISEEDIKQEEDRRASQTFWEERQSAMKGWLVNTILAAGMGFAICSALVLLGIIKTPTETEIVYVTQAANQTAQTLATALKVALRM